MKPLGPIPPGFEAVGGELAIAGQKSWKSHAFEGTPLFVYSAELIRRRMADLRAAMPSALKRDLPNFMQPHEIRWVERMPLNPNGKIDRAALQAEMAA